MTAILHARRGGDIGSLMVHDGSFETIDVSSLLHHPTRTLGITIECETASTTNQLCGIKPAGGLHLDELVDTRLEAGPSGQLRQCNVVCSLVDGGGGAKNIDIRSLSNLNHFYIVAEWGEGFVFLNTLYDRLTTSTAVNITALDQWVTVDATTTFATGPLGNDSGNVECVFVRFTALEGTGFVGLRPTGDTNDFNGRYNIQGPNPQVTGMVRVNDDNEFDIYIPEEKFGSDPAAASAITGWVRRSHGLYMLPELEKKALDFDNPAHTTWRTWSPRALNETGFMTTGPGFAPVASTIVLAKLRQPVQEDNRKSGLKTIHDKIGDRWLSDGTTCKPIEMDHAYRSHYQFNSVGATEEHLNTLGFYFPNSIRNFEDGALRYAGN